MYVYVNCGQTVINPHKREYLVIINLILIYRLNRLASPLVRAVSLLSGGREFELTSSVSYDFNFLLGYYAKQYVNSKIGMHRSSFLWKPNSHIKILSISNN